LREFGFESLVRYSPAGRGFSFAFLALSFRDGSKDQTRNFEIPDSMLRIAPE
jgi:hypothetical protein